MLEAANDDAGGNAEIGGESMEFLGNETYLLAECIQRLLGDEEIGGEDVCLLLFAAGFLIRGAVRGLNENVTFSVFKDIFALVKEGEPKKPSVLRQGHQIGQPSLFRSEL